MNIEKEKARQDRKIAKEHARQKIEIEEEKAKQDRKIARERAKQERELKARALSTKVILKMPTGMEINIEGADDQIVSLMNALTICKKQKAITYTDKDN